MEFSFATNDGNVIVIKQVANTENVVFGLVTKESGTVLVDLSRDDRDKLVSALGLF